MIMVLIEKRRLRRDCVSVQSRLGLLCPHKCHLELEESSDRGRTSGPAWVVAQAHLKCLVGGIYQCVILFIMLTELNYCLVLQL